MKSLARAYISIGRFGARHSDTLGKNGNKAGVQLSIWLRDAVKLCVCQDEIRGMFKDVGKGLDVDQRVEVEFLDID